MRKSYSCFFLLASFLLIFSGCDAIPEDALRINKMTLEDKQLQTQMFETSDEERILSASASILVDDGFYVVERKTDLGLLVASKERDVIDAGDILFSVAVGFAVQQSLSSNPKRIITESASVVTSPAGETGERTAVRVTFYKVSRYTSGRVSWRGKLNDPNMYQEFFDKLSKAVSMEEHGI